MHEIVIPYVNEERKIGDADQYALFIWDVFRGQKTEAVTSLLQEKKILNEYVPNNMTDYFQVLDLTVNKWVKDFMKQKFNEWFATQLRNESESGKELEIITIKFLLSTIKPLHEGCLIDCYNHTSHGREIILAGWRASGISAAVEDGLIGSLIDPFNENNPFDQTIEINMTSVVRPMSEEYINKEKSSMITTQTMSFAIWKIRISTENSYYQLFDIDHITFVAVIELKSVWKHLSVKTCII